MKGRNWTTLRLLTPDNQPACKIPTNRAPRRHLLSYNLRLRRGVRSCNVNTPTLSSGEKTLRNKVLALQPWVEHRARQIFWSKIGHFWWLVESCLPVDSLRRSKWLNFNLWINLALSETHPLLCWLSSTTGWLLCTCRLTTIAWLSTYNRAFQSIQISSLELILSTN